MASSRLTRLEFSLLAEDAELLQRYAKSHGIPASEIVRAALYSYVVPLKRAKEERAERTYREMEERRKLAAWNSEDPVRRHEAMIDEALEHSNRHD